jgi:hypothetical protein
MRLPTKLAFTAFHVAVAGTLACSAATDHGTDPAADAGVDVSTKDVGTQDVAPTEASQDADPRDASQDAGPREASIVDAATDVPSEGGDECDFYCGPATDDAACPGLICDPSECPLDAGCEPFV